MIAYPYHFGDWCHICVGVDPYGIFTAGCVGSYLMSECGSPLINVLQLTGQLHPGRVPYLHIHQVLGTILLAGVQGCHRHLGRSTDHQDLNEDDIVGAVDHLVGEDH